MLQEFWKERSIDLQLHYHAKIWLQQEIHLISYLGFFTTFWCHPGGLHNLHGMWTWCVWTLILSTSLSKIGICDPKWDRTDLRSCLDFTLPRSDSVLTRRTSELPISSGIWSSSSATDMSEWVIFLLVEIVWGWCIVLFTSPVAPLQASSLEVVDSESSKTCDWWCELDDCIDLIYSILSGWKFGKDPWRNEECNIGPLPPGAAWPRDNDGGAGALFFFDGKDAKVQHVRVIASWIRIIVGSKVYFIKSIGQFSAEKLETFLMKMLRRTKLMRIWFLYS